MARLRGKWGMIAQRRRSRMTQEWLPSREQRVPIKRIKMGGCAAVEILLRFFVMETGYFLVSLWKKKMANGIFRHAIR
ncbi:hypothetical protein CVS42_10300 [Aeromonas veronii]|nr:hypothetical protein CVS42_10300 [Aeromonas veronii]